MKLTARKCPVPENKMIFPGYWKLLFLTACLLCSGSRLALAQDSAVIREFSKTFKTYPFSDPDPIPDPFAIIYPYFRYDGFTDQPVQKEWKLVELENAYLKVTILPEVGGKIWSAIEKSTGKSFIYDNPVIKFRDVAMRGPWTSGGIEANYGIIGHTPNCATPVDYTTFRRADGSVSCTIGVLDLLTGSRWRLEINLPKDKAYFTTRSFWYNASPLEQPYYSWMNTGIKSKGNLQFIFPGSHYIGHEGEWGDWPINKQNGRDVSFYDQNNFGGYKSYHVFGKYSDFYGGYWHDDDFGMGRYSSHDDKAGKKIWIWGLSQQGMIWEHLLSDSGGQYVEVQSGRLFNQSAPGSTFTPFKHMGFAPYATDEWEEYWFPVKNTRGFVRANPYGALNIKNENGWLKIFFSPLQAIRDSLKVMDGNKTVYLTTLDLKPMQSFADSIRSNAQTGDLEVVLGDHKLDYRPAADADTLGRPLESPADFDWNSVYGLYLQGKEDIRQRFYPAAALKLKACLAKDPDYLPALDELGSLQFRNLEYREALVTIKKALSIDTYDPSANFSYGLINQKLGNITDARDGFDIASLSVEYRSPAFLELARICFRGKDLAAAMQYAGKCLVYNQLNLDAWQLEATIYRLQNDQQNAMRVLDKLLGMDPLSHFAAFEKYRWNRAGEKAFQDGIKNELPSETYLDLGIWYAQLGLRDDARKVFALAPLTAEIRYWKAFLEDKPVEIINPEPGTAFPYRAETAAMLGELIKRNSDWHLKYQLALIWWNRNQPEKAKELFSACGSEPDYAAFYAAKASLFPAEEESDLKRARSMDREQWRYAKLLTEYFIRKEQFPEARAAVESFYLTHPSNYILGMLYAKTLLLNKQYAKADTLLTGLDVIPFEGATDGRRLYQEAKLMQAISGIKRHQYKDALVFIQAARKWPENLGVGKPYAEDIDERPENWLNYLCYHFLGDKEKARQALTNIIHFAPANTAGKYLSANTLITAWALDKLNKREEAVRLLDRWIQQNPGNKIAAWGKQSFENPHTAVPEEIRKNEAVRMLGELIMDN